MNKRGILALFMAVMMLLISVPASAATVTLPGTPGVVTLPEEGISIPDEAYMRALSPDNTAGGHVNFQFADTENNVFGAPLQDIASGIIGATISAHVVYNGADEAAVKEWDLTDVPITGYSKASTGARLGVTLENIIAHSNGAINSAADFGTITANGYIADNETPAHALTNIVLKAGTSTYYAGAPGKEVNTDPFPEGTVFLSAQYFYNPGGRWASISGYEAIYGVVGNTARFRSKATDTYDIWILTTTYNGDTDNRAADVVVNDVKAPIIKDTTNYGFTAFWAQTGKTVTLTAGQKVSVVANASEPKRFIGLALVPTGAADKPTENFATDSTTGISNADLMKLHKATTDEFVAVTANVTVDGTEVTAASGAAFEAGVTTQATDATGAEIYNPTVADALVAAGKLPVTTGRVIAFLNGARVVNPDVTFVNAGDAITTQVVTDGFKPTALDNGNLISVYKGGPDGSVRMLFEPKLIAARFGEDYETTKPLDGAHLNGIAKPRMAGTTMKLDTMNGYVVFRNQYIDRTNYAYKTSGGSAYTEIYTTGSVKAVETTDGAVVKSGDEILGVHADRVKGDKYSYEWATLYFTDKYTTGKTIVIDNGTHKLITVDGADDLFIIIKNADGSIASTAHRLVTWETPYGLTLEAGQKAYVWRYSDYIGTNMMPLCTVVE